MHITSFKGYFCGSSIKVLKLQLPYFTSIHRISPFTTEFLYIEFMSTFTDFFVRIEADTDFTVFDFGMFLQINHRRYNFRDTGFVVGTEQRFSVGYNQVFPLMIQQFRELRWRKNHILFSTKHNIRAIIFFHNPRSDIFTCHIRTCIHVGNKSDSGYFFIYIGRKCSKKIAMLIQSNIFQSQRFQLFFQVFSKNHLLRSTWSKSSRFIRLCIEAYIL